LPKAFTFTLNLLKTFTIEPVLLIFFIVVIPASILTFIPAFAPIYIPTSALTPTTPMVSVAILTFALTFITPIVLALALTELTLLSIPKIAAALSPVAYIPTKPQVQP
jgi:hypothetical protein